MNDDQISYWGKITILIHTRNRPLFLLRVLDYYDKKLGSVEVSVIILDASDDKEWSVIAKQISSRNYSLDIHVLHHSPLSLFSQRLSDALQSISTPYILLAADDDLYFFDWIKPAVNLLDTDTTYGVVYGHTLKFELESYKPFGKLVNFFIVKERNPPARWLEGETPLERLTELGKSNLATVGWYALQRTELLKTTVDNALQNEIDGLMFEKLLIFCQAALTKTRMLDFVYLARQVNSAEVREPLSFKGEWEKIKKLMEVSTVILSKNENIGIDVAKIIVDDVFRAEVKQYNKADSKKYLRIVANRFPYLRRLWSRFSCFLGLERSRLGQYLPDSRFPCTPKVDLDHPRRKDIIDATSCAKIAK